MFGIELILTQSSNAKGRVERMFKTLQGRWPQEFRVDGISGIAKANMRISEFIEIHNVKYAIDPTDEHDTHIGLARCRAYLCRMVRKASQQVTRRVARWTNPADC